MKPTFCCSCHLITICTAFQYCVVCVTIHKIKRGDREKETKQKSKTVVSCFSICSIQCMCMCVWANVLLSWLTFKWRHTNKTSCNISCIITACERARASAINFNPRVCVDSHENNNRLNYCVDFLEVSSFDQINFIKFHTIFCDVVSPLFRTEEIKISVCKDKDTKKTRTTPN